MRSYISPFSPFILAIFFLVPFSEVKSESQQMETINGKVSSIVFDMKNGTEEHIYRMKTEGGSEFPLKFSAKDHFEGVKGNLDLVGEFVDNRGVFLVNSYRKSAGDRKFSIKSKDVGGAAKVLSATFKIKGTKVAAPVKRDIAAALNRAKYIFRASSSGLFTIGGKSNPSDGGDIVGPFTLSLRKPVSYYCEDKNKFYEIRHEMLKTLVDNGVRTSGYDFVQYIVPQEEVFLTKFCAQFVAVAELGCFGQRCESIYFNAESSHLGKTMAHELGHNLGFGHAINLIDDSIERNSVMGPNNTLNPYPIFNPAYQDKLGWNFDMQSISIKDFGLYKIAPFNTHPLTNRVPTVTKYPLTLKIALPHSNSFLYVAYQFGGSHSSSQMLIFESNPDLGIDSHTRIAGSAGVSKRFSIPHRGIYIRPLFNDWGHMSVEIGESAKLPDLSHSRVCSVAGEEIDGKLSGYVRHARFEDACEAYESDSHVCYRSGQVRDIYTGNEIKSNTCSASASDPNGITSIVGSLLDGFPGAASGAGMVESDHNDASNGEASDGALPYCINSGDTSEGQGYGWEDFKDGLGFRSCRIQTRSGGFLHGVEAREEERQEHESSFENCDYTHEGKNDGWGWNSVDGVSCPPLNH